MPGCQSSFCRQRSNIAICIQKVSCPEKCRLDKTTSRGRNRRGQRPKGEGERTGVRAFSICLSHIHQHTPLPPRASLLVPQLPPVLSIRDEKGKSSPRPRLLIYSYTCRLGLQDATRVRAKSFFSSCQVDEREAALITHSPPSISSSSAAEPQNAQKGSQISLHP